MSGNPAFFQLVLNEFFLSRAEPPGGQEAAYIGSAHLGQEEGEPDGRGSPVFENGEPQIRP